MIQASKELIYLLDRLFELNEALLCKSTESATNCNRIRNDIKSTTSLKFCNCCYLQIDGLKSITSTLINSISQVFNDWRNSRGKIFRYKCTTPTALKIQYLSTLLQSLMLFINCYRQDKYLVQVHIEFSKRNILKSCLSIKLMTVIDQHRNSWIQ